MKLNLSSLSSLRKGLALSALVVSAASSSSCLQRPVCGEGPNGNSCEPKTTNVIVDQLVQNAVDKIDMLFVIDNSASMADKQAILKEALPDLVNRFVSPICVDDMGVQKEHPLSGTDECPPGSQREFEPIKDIHIGVVTSSLGGYTSPYDCVADPMKERSEDAVDMAHLLGSLPRGSQATGGQDFLRWTGGGREMFTEQFQNLVASAGEFGCGWEAPLEAWYRFLVEPYPHQGLERAECRAGDPVKGCIVPTRDASGNAIVDPVILKQRADFLRPDSLVAIIMLSDENDCSFRASGQSWTLSQAVTADSAGNRLLREAFRGSAACDQDPNSPCCQSCGSATVNEGCPSIPNPNGTTPATVPQGCDPRKYDVNLDPPDPKLSESINLRCFDQKRRFGIDHLYPVERYSRALTSPDLCPFVDTLDPGGCKPDQLVKNPLFDDLGLEARLKTDPAATRRPQRPASLVFLAGIVGVPWQDVAVSPKATDNLVYRSAKQSAADARRINWEWLIGSEATKGVPADPLMIESIDPRSGVNPATMEALADPNAGPLANSINGHEWNIRDRGDLQYACIFPRAEQVCPEVEDNTGVATPNCDCTQYGGGGTQKDFNNPLCQKDATTYDRTQRYAKAYPSVRQLQVLKEFGANSIVASICPKETADKEAPDYGYRPAVAAIVERLKEQLADKCLPRELSVDKETGAASCRIIEAVPSSGSAACDTSSARLGIEPAVVDQVTKALEAKGRCGDTTGQPCDQFQMCEIKQLLASEDAAGLESCQNNPNSSSGNGWCYIDPDKGIGSAALVEKCPDTEKRKLRFVGKGSPINGSVTFFACAGAVFDGNPAQGSAGATTN